MLAATLLGGCQRRTSPGQAAAPDLATRAAIRDAPNWSRDVRPLIDVRCGACHGSPTAAALAPPFLGTFQDLRRNAMAALQAIRRRTMPPFGADNSGLCGHWADASWLSNAEIETFDGWVQAGMPAGEPTIPTAQPPPSPPRQRESVRLDLGGAFSPGLGDRASRCFVVESIGNRGPALLGLGVSVEPAGAVRQATLWALSARAVQAARQLDDATEESGWPCPGAVALEDARLLTSWSRNTPDQRLPTGTGVPLAGAKAFAIQLRYDLIASPPGVPVRARLDLSTGAAARIARFVPIESLEISLPAGQPRTQAHALWTAARSLELWGLIPSMNTLGRVLTVDLIRGTQRHCVAHFGHWDRYDQQLFRRIAPLPLRSGDVVALTCEFSTTSRTAAIKMGEAPDDERCLAQLYVTDQP